jgi:hypothetical protein
MTADDKPRVPLYIPPPRKPIDPQEPNDEYEPDGDFGSDDIERSRSQRYDR